MNIAYKHLDTKLRIAELTIGQWLGVLVGIALGLVWGVYLSPFGIYLTLFSAIYLGGIPVGAMFLASVTEFDLWLLLRSAMRWRRREGRFVPGPGALEPRLRRSRRRPMTTANDAAGVPADLDPASLWEELMSKFGNRRAAEQHDSVRGRRAAGGRGDRPERARRHQRGRVRAHPHVIPPNPMILSGEDREQIAAGYCHLVSRLRPSRRCSSTSRRGR